MAQSKILWENSEKKNMLCAGEDQLLGVDSNAILNKAETNILYIAKK